MSEGSPIRALIWSVAVGLGLLAWPWLLAWLQRRRPEWLTGVQVVDLPALRAGLDRPGSVRSGTLVAWLGLVTVAAVMPAARGLLGADLDAGLLWVITLAVLAVSGSAGLVPRWTASGLMTLTLCILPIVVRSASLNLADVAIAQQGGAGNWFLIRDPFILMAALVYLLAAAALWPRPSTTDAPGAQLVLDAAVRAGLPLVLAHLFTVVFLGGWWAFAPFLDGAALVNTGLKTLAVMVVLVALRRRSDWTDSEHLIWLLPLAALICAVGGAIWMTLTGAAW